MHTSGLQCAYVGNGTCCHVLFDFSVALIFVLKKSKSRIIHPTPLAVTC
jgi:hypothetical protein